MQREEVDRTETGKRKDVEEQRWERQPHSRMRAAAARHSLDPG